MKNSNTKYLKLPLNLNYAITPGKEIPRTDHVIESVHQMAHLILNTVIGEYNYDPNLGCQIWEKKFEILPSLLTEKAKTMIKQSIRNALTNFEKRLDIGNLEVKFGQETLRLKRNDDATTTHAKTMDIIIEGKVKQKDFYHEEKIYLK